MDTMDIDGEDIALLIDGQNISPRHIDVVFKEISKFGQVRIKRLYGDWSDGQMGKWKDKATEYAITPEMVITNISGKNASDIRLVIDAMDLLAKKSVDIICILSSDSDYSQLATKLKEEGIKVIGVGEANTHRSLQNACDRFIFIENLHDEQVSTIVETVKKGAIINGSEDSNAAPFKKREPEDAIPLLKQAISNSANEDGRVHLSVLKETILRMDPSFDERTFGKKKLSELIRGLNANFITEHDKKKGPGDIYVRIKN